MEQNNQGIVNMSKLTEDKNQIGKYEVRILDSRLGAPTGMIMMAWFVYFQHLPTCNSVLVFQQNLIHPHWKVSIFALGFAFFFSMTQQRRLCGETEMLLFSFWIFTSGCVQSFNFDSESPVIFTNSFDKLGSYFGATVAFAKGENVGGASRTASWFVILCLK